MAVIPYKMTTYVSTRGSSVVDYTVIPYELIGSFDSFKVTRVTSLAQSIDAAGIYDLRTILPDHSLLTWNINLNFSYSEAEQVRANIQRTRQIKYNMRGETLIKYLSCLVLSV
jgi:hypothetical protein